MTSELVSVYIPTKNRLPLLKVAISSVLNQSYSEIECIVCDDGSSDGTLEYLRAVSAHDHRLKWLTNTRSHGACGARNCAIHAATGRFITGLDDDDRFESSRIQGFINAWNSLVGQAAKFSALYSQDVIESPKGAVISDKPASASYNDLFISNYIGNQVFTLRERILAVGGFDEELPMWQDLDCWLRLTSKFGGAVMTPAPTYIFDNNPRAGRLTLQGKLKLRRAHDLIAAKYRNEARLQLAQLFLQMFSRSYRTPVSWREFVIAVERGYPAAVLVSLGRAMVRNLLPT